MILLLHDLQQTALAKDLRDLCIALGVEPVMIAFEPNDTPTLGAKEEKAINQCVGAIFLVTPRNSDGTISGSVVHELGQLSKKFQNSPEKIILIAEQSCVFPAIEQRPRITYQDGDTASILRAVEFLVIGLKRAQFLSDPAQTLPSSSIEADSIAVAGVAGLSHAIIALGNSPNALMTDGDLVNQLVRKEVAALQINVVKKEMRVREIATPRTASNGTVYWQLTDKGIDLARVESDRKSKVFTEALEKIVPGFKKRYAPGSK